MTYNKIDVVVHPQSIVHSLVEYIDGSVIAQMGLPDMKLPIQYALSYPERYNQAFGHLDLIKVGKMTFEEPDLETFPALKLAYHAGEKSGVFPCYFNSAFDEDVYSFFDD